MAGRQDFSAPGSKGSGQTVAVTNRPEMKEVVASVTGSVAAGASETVEVYAPTGSVYTARSMFLQVSADGNWASGDHVIKVKPINSRDILYMQSDYLTDLLYQFGEIRSANNLSKPSTAELQRMVMGSLIATENSPITVEYRNRADAAQDNARNYEFTMEENSY